MNRKNLTAAVLAGLAGAAGIAGTAQAVNMNPDGLGQVLVYPYYTANDGNQTILSVVNTTDQAKAVKVRFLEGFNSREVLDFNLYLSHHDVWVASIRDFGASTDGSTVPYLAINDTSCTVPYLYPDGGHAFLDLAYTIFPDGGPTGIQRAAEGHFEMIEMGTLTGAAAVAATHGANGMPADCAALELRWTEFTNADNGDWYDEAQDDGQASTDTSRNSGGLFGGAAVVNANNGTMFSYNARAIQGFDKTDDGIHYIPGDVNPGLDDGDQQTAVVFFGVPQNTATPLSYNSSVEAVSAVFMHENVMNDFATMDEIGASTEWIVTFPTKNFYVDPLRLADVESGVWIPDTDDVGCGGWVPGEDYPEETGPGPHDNDGWEHCTYVFSVNDQFARSPFTKLFDAGGACELFDIRIWDREEFTFVPTDPGGSRPPEVSPSLPGPCDPQIETCSVLTNQICYEVNVLRFGDGEIFGTPDLGGQSLLLEIDTDIVNGWTMMNFSVDPRHRDYAGLVGLPVTGFAAMEFENEFVDGDDIKAFYGGLFDHKANVRRVNPIITPQ